MCPSVSVGSESALSPLRAVAKQYEAGQNKLKTYSRLHSSDLQFEVHARMGTISNISKSIEQTTSCRHSDGAAHCRHQLYVIVFGALSVVCCCSFCPNSLLSASASASSIMQFETGRKTHALFSSSGENLLRREWFKLHSVTFECVANGCNGCKLCVIASDAMQHISNRYINVSWKYFNPIFNRKRLTTALD